MKAPQGYLPCTVSGEHVEGFWEIAFAFGDDGNRSIKLRVGPEDIDQLLQLVTEGSRLLKYQQLVQGQERLQAKRRRRAVARHG